MGDPMNIHRTDLEGIRVIEPPHFIDERGTFTKTFHKEAFEKESLGTDFQESYYSTSKKNVIRGMHFQSPPQDHAKLVYVTRGSILDVVLDIRKNSPTYGKHLTFELSAENHKAIYIPSGFAHGFLSLEDGTAVTYLQTTMHSPEHDKGIHAHSFGLQWDISKPIMSERDLSFPHFEEFQTPFQ
ncbi:MAG: dTDP-4-dehydrorhamnose 3,5-epimerase [Patescibacteria group bacterium]|jgi:dTDP-4-dehydrorhamnose 3,5-epimerase|nr:dTDP-4-dehydrorhamnose 3,5-epimerase [Patescibacteria group bacterium]